MLIFPSPYVASAPSAAAYFTTDATVETYFKDTANVPSGVTKIEWRMKVRLNSTPASTDVFFTQESLGFDLYVFNAADPFTFGTRVEDGTGATMIASHKFLDAGAADVTAAVGAWHTIVCVCDQVAETVTLTLNGTTHPAVPFTGTSNGVFQTTREVGALANTSGGNPLPGGTDVEYFEVYFNDVLHKRIAGSDGAAAINSDTWKLGNDVTVT